MTMMELENEIEGFLYRKSIDDRRTARVCMVLAEINRDKKAKPRPYTEDDFMPTGKKEKKEQSPQEMYNALKAITIALGGEVIEK